MKTKLIFNELHKFDCYLNMEIDECYCYDDPEDAERLGFLNSVYTERNELRQLQADAYAEENDGEDD